MDSRAAHHSVASRFRRLSRSLISEMRDWDGESWPDDRFDRFARDAFEVQYSDIEPYKRYCRNRDATPAVVTSWTEIPPVPVAAFRHVPLIVGGEEDARLVFQTSGTTSGTTRRGRHFVREPALYRASMEAAFQRLCLGYGEPWRLGSLVPPFAETDGSSLAWMIDGLMERFGADGSRHLASGSGIDWRAADDFAAGCASDGIPACLLATTLGLAEWLRQLEETDRCHRLPEGSIVMDTGGAKGRDDLSRSRVCDRAVERLGVSTHRIVNEFGMTELLSQLYSVRGPEPTSGARRDVGHSDSPWLEGPPWLRVRALDPNDLGMLPDGEPGLLCYFDLANLGGICSVLTEDIGRVSGRRVQWLHRFPGAPPRGCSLATAEIIARQRSAENG